MVGLILRHTRQFSFSTAGLRVESLTVDEGSVGGEKSPGLVLVARCTQPVVTGGYLGSMVA